MQSLTTDQCSGGKAQALMRLVDAGFRVPPFFVLSHDSTEDDIAAGIARVLPTVRSFAVRSSAVGEDSRTQSFAGHFYSAVGVTRADLSLEIERVRASYGDLSGGVIVQEFIPSDSAGALFTRVGHDVLLINAIPGLCVPVVQGQPCDEYICTLKGEVIVKTIPAKGAQYFEDGRIISREVLHESLSEAQVGELVALARRIEMEFASPQDVEWCVRNGEVYVLQSRPITRDVPLPYIEYFDSANIAESYSGIVLPLTCTFAQVVYAQVYKDLLQMSGVSRTKIERHTDVFDGLLAFFNGRMFYRMNNWYRMAEFVPGYRRNKQNFEAMITSNVRSDVSTIVAPSLVLRLVYPWIVLAKLVWYGITARRFKARTRLHIRELRARDFDRLAYGDCVALFRKLNTHLLRRWYITVENDFLVMTHLGLLTKLVGEEALQDYLVFPSKATEQVAALAGLSARMYEEPHLRSAIEQGDVVAYERELSKHAELRALLARYVDTFGGRFANELKLESTGIDEDPKALLSVLKAFRTYAPPVMVLRAHSSVPFPKSILVRSVARWFKKYAGQREEFRLLRSNTFSMARKLFRQMGRLLARDGAIADPDDVFYMELVELLGHVQGADYRTIIAHRKSDYATYAVTKPPAHFAAVAGAQPLYRSANQRDAETLTGRPASPGRIRGRVRVFKDFVMPETIDFDIVVTSHTDPGWTSLIALSKGLIIEHGGVLSHASIVARELGIPAVIGARGAVDVLRTGDMVEIDGSTGMIAVLSL